MRQPFTVSSLCTTLLVLAAVSSVYTGKDFGLRHNITVGACGVLAIFLVFCAVQFPDGAFVRPNVIVWRVVKGLTLLYMCLLVFLLCQSVEDVRSALSIIDPTTEEILYETNYAEDCRLITPDHPDGALGNILERIDVFVLAHFFGWLVKALIIRNEKLLWVLSLAFEWAEISLRHILPNFWECWWDHLLLDVFGCNLLGIYCGLWLAERLQMREYKDWIFHSRSKPFYYHSRLLSQLLPENYSQHHWPKFMRNGTTFVAMVAFVVLATLFDVNLFFLKAQLHIDTSHWVCLLRTVLMAFGGAHAVRECYELLVTPSTRKLGVQAWLVMGVLMAEAMLVVRWRSSLDLSNTLPPFQKSMWTFLAGAFAVITTYLYAVEMFSHRSKTK